MRKWFSKRVKRATMLNLEFEKSVFNLSLFSGSVTIKHSQQSFARCRGLRKNKKERNTNVQGEFKFINFACKQVKENGQNIYML